MVFLKRILSLIVVMAAAAGISYAGAYTADVDMSGSRGQEFVHTDFYGEGGGGVRLDPAMSDSWETSAVQPGADSPAGTEPVNLPSSDISAGQAEKSGPAGPSGDDYQPNPPSYHSQRRQAVMEKRQSSDDNDLASPDISRHSRAEKESETPRANPFANKSHDMSRYSLWQGLSSPLTLPAAKVGQASADDATSMGRQDYASHILGEGYQGGTEPAESAYGEKRLSGAENSSSPSSQGHGRIFVTLNLNSAAGTLKDALADLSRTAAFSLDGRFGNPALATAKNLTLSGWVPADRLGAALRNPAVTRLEVAPGPQVLSSNSRRAEEILLGVRVPPGESFDQALKKVMGNLSSSADFRWKKTVGYQRIPHSRDRALIIQGEIPLSQISRVMADSAVVKVVPFLFPLGDASSYHGGAAASGKEESQSFLSFVWSRFPFLLILTAFALLPALADALTRVAEAFIPYRVVDRTIQMSPAARVRHSAHPRLLKT